MSAMMRDMMQDRGEVAERSKAAVLKTVDRVSRSGGSNPSLSAISMQVNESVNKKLRDNGSVIRGRVELMEQAEVIKWPFI